MENWKEELQNYLPTVEKFLTSVLLEETEIGIASSDNVDHENVLNGFDKKDIFLFTRDQKHQADFIIILDKEWYGLLSSIMLGVEEKTNNEITRDLLKKFSSELSATLKRQMKTDGMETDPEEIQVLTLKQMEDVLGNGEYLHAKLEVAGLADDKVRAEFLLGNPESQLQDEPAEEEKPEPKAGKKAKGKKADAQNESAKEDEFSKTEAEEMERAGREEPVINARQIEFDDFQEHGPEYQNGDSRSMDLLKDVEMDVAVELGRIELPLGKVLELAKGSVIELEKLAGEPVDILVNGHCIAKGEVVVIDEHFGVRISNLITTRQRIAGLK